MAQNPRDPWADLASRRGFTPAVPPAPSTNTPDPWTDLATRRGVLETQPRGMIDRIKGMELSDWTALATRIGGGIASNVGFLPGALISGGSEALAQWQEDRFSPWEIAAQTAIGAVPFGKLFGAGVKPVMQGAGLLPRTVNAAASTGVGALKGAAVGGGTVTAQTLIGQGRLPESDEFKTGVLLGTGGGALAGGLTRQAAKAFGSAPDGTVVPPASAQLDLFGGGPGGPGGAGGGRSRSVYPDYPGDVPARAPMPPPPPSRAATSRPFTTEPYTRTGYSKTPRPAVSFNESSGPPTVGIPGGSMPASRSTSSPADFLTQIAAEEPGLMRPRPTGTGMPAPGVTPDPDDLLESFLAVLRGEDANFTRPVPSTSGVPELPGAPPAPIGADFAMPDTRIRAPRPSGTGFPTPGVTPAPEDLLESFLGGLGKRTAPGAPDASVGPSRAPAAAVDVPSGDPVDILTEVMATAGYSRPPVGAGGLAAAASDAVDDPWTQLAVRRGVAPPAEVPSPTMRTVDQLRDTAGMGRPNHTFVGEPEILPPARAGEEAFSQPVGRSSTVPEEFDPEDLIAEWLGTGLPRPTAVAQREIADAARERLANRPGPGAPEDIDVLPPAAPIDELDNFMRSPSDYQKIVDVPMVKPPRNVAELPAEEARELRRILAEMEEFGFQRGESYADIETRLRVDSPDDRALARGMAERTQGKRSNILLNEAGAPVFHDIMAGTKGTRGQVINAVRRYLEGGAPSKIAQRAVHVAQRRLAGDRNLGKAMLPPEAGDVSMMSSLRKGPFYVSPDQAVAPGVTTGRDVGAELAELGMEAPRVPGIPDPITELWESLRPRWQKTVEQQAGDNIPFTVDPYEELEDFARRIANDPPESLWRAERQVREQLERTGALDALRNMPRSAGDEGAAGKELLYHLGATGTGAVAGPLLDKDTADPRVSAIGGALTGLGTSLAVRNPRLLERMRSSGLFSGAAIPKSFLGNVGGLTAYGLENPGTGRAILEETFKPETVDALRAGFNRPMAREASSMTLESPFSLPGRMIGAPDFASRDIIQRVEGRVRGGNLPGIPTGAQAAAGGDYTLSGDPHSGPFKAALEQTADSPWLRLIAPVVRTPLNWIERGLERTPGVGGMTDVANWTGTTPELVRRRQALGALAILAGGAAGGAAAGSPAGDIDVNPLPFGPQTLEGALPFISAAAGPYGLPLTMGVEGGKSLFGNRGSALGALGDMAMSVQEGLPLPTPYAKPDNMMRTFLPYSAAMRALSPVDPKDFETSTSHFGPLVAQIPVLNEALFPRKRKPKPRVNFGGR